MLAHGAGWTMLNTQRLESVSWFNTSRLLEPLGYLPPAEYEAQFQEQFQELQTATTAAGASK